MVNKISMVPFEKLLDVYFDAHNNDNMKNDPLNPFETAYENGMIEVIKEIAQTKLLQYELNRGSSSTIDRDATEHAIAAFQHAMDLASTPEQKKALMEIDSTYNRCAGKEADEYFITGFIMGYKFLKELKESSRA
ncbi:hypothetical protein J2S74_000424 [Evansella vedderi]|uniref:Uncharacterized protein n=1 Tax=Evansella vedderi TaxID=38282 RepID=A0ABT9ZP86_9BACI|nr:hypothetical protein [Evansella vedderi]MDQ0253052.1 hypothetical protein [Evansella vedderi]